MEYIDLAVSQEWNSITIRFENERQPVLDIGKRINQINKYAYMNGYNWAVLIEYILEKDSPEDVNDLESMPEGGSYFMRYQLSNENSFTV